MLTSTRYSYTLFIHPLIPFLQSLGQKVGVTGFPTLKWYSLRDLALITFRFPKGSTTAEDYNGGREEDAFYDFIAQKTGKLFYIFTTTMG